VLEGDAPRLDDAERHCPVSNLRETVIPAAGMVVVAAGGARSEGRVAGESQALALLTPSPVTLANGSGVVRDEEVVAAAGVVVVAARRTGSEGRVAGEGQALALLAPAPVAL
jgi:hypothetical protein